MSNEHVNERCAVTYRYSSDSSVSDGLGYTGLKPSVGWADLGVSIETELLWIKTADTKRFHKLLIRP